MLDVPLANIVAFVPLIKMLVLRLAKVTGSPLLVVAIKGITPLLRKLCVVLLLGLVKEITFVPFTTTNTLEIDAAG